MRAKLEVKREGALQVKFWGVRGSHPVAGVAYSHFGGNTPCVEVRCGTRLFVIDAGNGIIPLGVDLTAEAPARIDLLLSHLHLDHISGLPFFKPAFNPATIIDTWCGNLEGRSAEAALGKIFAPPLFPVTLSQFPATFRHHGFMAGETLRFDDGFEIKTCLLKHPSSATGYRFEHNGRSICYVSDIEHEMPWPPETLARFVADADLIIYDGMFSEEEYTRCVGWGHSTWKKGVELCQAAGVKAMAIFHLHPLADDDKLRAVERELKREMPTAFIARDGLALNFDDAVVPAREPLRARG
jgi:phosphoribosyl 1,2-cyclic phosphodiesterase